VERQLGRDARHPLGVVEAHRRRLERPRAFGVGVAILAVAVGASAGVDGLGPLELGRGQRRQHQRVVVEQPLVHPAGVGGDHALLGQPGHVAPELRQLGRELARRTFVTGRGVELARQPLCLLHHRLLL
jgi:hypothetical protein